MWPVYANEIFVMNIINYPPHDWRGSISPYIICTLLFFLLHGGTLFLKHLIEGSQTRRVVHGFKYLSWRLLTALCSGELNL